MRPGPAAFAAPMLIAALVLPGCGDEQTTAAGAEKSARRTQATTGGPTADARGTKATAGAASHRQTAQCRRALGDFLDAVESLNNSVAVGVSYDSYLTAVNHVRATYAPIQPEHLPLLCLTQVAVPAERALNTYIEAANTWGECLASVSCNPGTIEARLQHEWAAASDRLTASQAGLRSLR